MKKLIFLSILFFAVQAHAQSTDAMETTKKSANKEFAEKPTEAETVAAKERTKKKIRQDIRKRRAQRKDEMAKAKKGVEKRIKKEKTQN